ncbi:MAG: hypothetical protein J0G32_02195 [Alphaproteobacteria bacterium]|nr:hypothetical protein [Alphaproteobacteria bacterium]OJV12227.1 MAG: hypothetical protein BGO27_05775 [Alphaproteobacteria bacterium 33-17]
MSKQSEKLIDFLQLPIAKFEKKWNSIENAEDLFTKEQYGLFRGACILQNFDVIEFFWNRYQAHQTSMLTAKDCRGFMYLVKKGQFGIARWLWDAASYEAKDKILEALYGHGKSDEGFFAASCANVNLAAIDFILECNQYKNTNLNKVWFEFQDQLFTLINLYHELKKDKNINFGEYEDAASFLEAMYHQGKTTQDSMSVLQHYNSYAIRFNYRNHFEKVSSPEVADTTLRNNPYYKDYSSSYNKPYYTEKSYKGNYL